jgi:hypothetical protein
LCLLGDHQEAVLSTFFTYKVQTDDCERKFKSEQNLIKCG